MPQCIYATVSLFIISLRTFSLFHFLTIVNIIARNMDKKLSVEWDVEPSVYMPRTDIAGP